MSSAHDRYRQVEIKLFEVKARLAVCKNPTLKYSELIGERETHQSSIRSEMAPLWEQSSTVCSSGLKHF
jgi:hypothetical protein